VARPRADDYEDKRALIFDRAAELFAEQGFSRTSIAELAAHCGASKSWIYHYFPSKEAILYAILRDHMTLLLRTAETEVGRHQEPEAQLRALLRAFMAIYVRAQAKHMVLLAELGCLPAGQQSEIRGLERRVVDLVAGVLDRLETPPATGRDARMPITMMLFGMINWTYTWYRPDGPISPAQLANLAADLFLDGLRNASRDPALHACGLNADGAASGAADPYRGHRNHPNP
jgi:TetR/AcrR family transcriptional regulator